MAIQSMNTAPARIGKTKGGIIGNAMQKKRPRAKTKSKVKATKRVSSYF